jgi:hypothetical protein
MIIAAAGSAKPDARDLGEIHPRHCERKRSNLSSLAQEFVAEIASHRSQ